MIVDRTHPGKQPIRRHLAGTQHFSVNGSQVGQSCWGDVVDLGFFLILDVAMGGAFTNAFCGCTSPTGSTTSGAAMSVSAISVAVARGPAARGPDM